MKTSRWVPVVALLVAALSGCAVGESNIDPDMPLPEAKARAQSVERDIAEALPDDLVISIHQNETGSFLACSQDGGEQWAGGLTVRVHAGVTAQRLLDPVEQRFTDASDMKVARWDSDGDSIVEISGLHLASWIVRYDPAREEVHVSSFSPCIHLPDDVWRGDTY